MIFEKTHNKPFVNLSIEDCIFEIKGSSFSKSVTERYTDILKWMDKEIPKLKGELICSFYFDVINSISYRSIMEIFSKFSHYQEKGKRFNVTWYYDEDDEDNLENAEDLSDVFDIPISIKETQKRGLIP